MAELSDREKEILRLVAKGYSLDAIARATGRDVAEIRRILHSVLARLIGEDNGGKRDG